MLISQRQRAPFLTLSQGDLVCDNPTDPALGLCQTPVSLPDFDTSVVFHDETSQFYEVTRRPRIN